MSRITAEAVTEGISGNFLDKYMGPFKEGLITKLKLLCIKLNNDSNLLSKKDQSSYVLKKFKKTLQVCLGNDLELVVKRSRKSQMYMVLLRSMDSDTSARIATIKVS
jgi:hypothetical protein